MLLSFTSQKSQSRHVTNQYYGLHKIWKNLTVGQISLNSFHIRLYTGKIWWLTNLGPIFSRIKSHQLICVADQVTGAYMVDKFVLNWFMIVQNFWKLYRFKVKLIFFTFPNLLLSGAIKQYKKSRILYTFWFKGSIFCPRKKWRFPLWRYAFSKIISNSVAS